MSLFTIDEMFIDERNAFGNTSPTFCFTCSDTVRLRNAFCFTKAIRSYLYNITLILKYINNIQSYLHCALSLKDHEVKVTLNIW